MNLREIIYGAGKGAVNVPDYGAAEADVCTWIMIVNQRWIRVFHCGDSGLELVTELVRIYSGALSDPLCFSSGITGWLEEAAKNEAFDRLVLVAPMPMIANMRAAFSARILDRVVTDIGGVSTGIRLV